MVWSFSYTKNKMIHVKKLVNANLVYEKGHFGEGINIAVLDTGIYPHVDFSNRIINFVDFVKERSECYDDNGHGTHISGILAGDGTVSSGRITGIAKAARLHVLKVLDRKGSGKTKDVLKALSWVQANYKTFDIRLLNFSVGFLPEANKKDEKIILEMLEAIWDSGVAIVAAAGNNGPERGTITAPGIMPKVITVGAFDDCVGKGLKNGYSGKGPTNDCIVKPEVLAPGSFIFSTANNKNSYVYKSGTSMATPVVCGALALALSCEKTLAPAELKLLLYKTSKHIEGVAQTSAWGLIDVDKMIKMIE